MIRANQPQVPVKLNVVSRALKLEEGPDEDLPGKKKIESKKHVLVTLQ